MLNDNAALTLLVALAQGTRLRAMRALLRSHPEASPQGASPGKSMARPPRCRSISRSWSRRGWPGHGGKANSVIYTAVPEALGGLLNYLLDDCCGSRPNSAPASSMEALGEPVAASTCSFPPAISPSRCPPDHTIERAEWPTGA